MKLIVGLGNPETKYAQTRHNLGFTVLDAYAEQADVSFQAKNKFKADIAEISVDGEKALLVKPTTYYNLSGEAVRAAADFYKITPENILIVHDELALPFGRLRTRRGGSDAGNNGVKSITQHTGQDTARLRLGIYNELRDRIDDADFVLSQFTGDEKRHLDDIIDTACGIIGDFVCDRFEVTSH